ncbi:MAG TPA: DUF433 domain-containing protein [Lacipirellulaceae bacterium]|nr:DUF433 domain-containing protein [Lacipirellulaceae bacterium]
MAQSLIQDNDNGPVIAGTRVTVYSLIPYLLDEAASEESIANSFGITTAQVSAARAYVVENAPTILARHYELEERAQRGNSLETVEKLRRSHVRLLSFKEWLKEREALKAQDANSSASFPSFEEWLLLRQKTGSGA